MSTRKYLIKKSLMTMFATCCVMVASAGTPPFFTTDVVLNAKGELLMAQKGTSRLDVFSPDGKSLLRSYPLAESPTGVLVDGDKAYVTVKDHQLKKKEDARVEAHDKYIDIQIVIRGTESFGWVSRSDCKTVQTPMNEEKDIIFYADAPTTYVTLSSGQMVIFFPGDGHAPLVGDGTVRKAIVKVAVE